MTENYVINSDIVRDRDRDRDHIVYDLNPIVCDPIVCDYNNGSINRNFCSSMLFLLPAIYSYSIGYSIVMVGSIICLLTSTIHHYYKARNKILQTIDRICVNSIATYFIFICLTTIGCTFYANLMYICATLALSLFFYIHFKPHLYENYYFLVHLCAISGIMFYIKAHHNFLLGHIAGD